jgi:gas vesicle protein
MKNLMKSKKMWIAFCIVFLSGIAIGVVVGMTVKRSPAKKECKQQGMMKIRLLRHMSDELKLTTDQKVSVDEIITGMTDEISVLHNEQRPKIKNIIDTAFADIDKILTEDQKTKMERLKERMAKSRRMRHNKEERKGRQCAPPRQRYDGGEQFKSHERRTSFKEREHFKNDERRRHNGHDKRRRLSELDRMDEPVRREPPPQKPVENEMD